MKKAANVLYLLFVIVAIGVTALLIVQDYNRVVSTQRTDFQSRYLNHQRTIENMFQDGLYEKDQEFQNALLDISVTDSSLEGLILLIPGKSVFFNHIESNDKKLLSEFGTPQLDTGPDSLLQTYKSMTHDIYSVPIRTELQENIQAFFIYQTYSRTEILRHLRLALIPVSILFILTLLIIIVITRNNGSDNEGDDLESDPLFANINADVSSRKGKKSSRKKNKSSSQDDSELFKSDESSEPGAGDMDFDLPGESDSSDMDMDLPEDTDSMDMDFDLPDDSGSSDMDFDLPDESPSPDMDMDLSNDSDEGAMDFEMPDEGSMDFDIPSEENLENIDGSFGEGENSESTDDEVENFDFDLPDEEELEAPSEDSLEDLDFDMPEDNTDTGTDDFSFDLPEEEETDTSETDEANLDDLDFDLPEEETEAEEMNLDDMDFDLPEEETSEESNTEELNLDDLDLDIPEDEASEEPGAEELNLDDLDLDLPEEETSEEPDAEELNLDDMAFDLPEEETAEESESGLYVESTGLSKEDLFQDRLEQELNRASSNNENLVVSYIQLQDSSEENLKKMSDKLKAQWDNPDLAFQWGNQGICLISQDSDLTPLLEQLEKIYEDTDQQMRIGVSSRNGRLLSKDLLIEEAQKALERSTDQKPIIGFSADPEKFRAVNS